MKRLFGSVLLLGVSLIAQSPKSVQSTLLALKDSGAPRKALSDELVDEMMALAKKSVSAPSRAAVERFSEDLTSALRGRDVTAVRAEVLQNAIVKVLSGRGSNFEPATRLRETLTNCGISSSTVTALVARFIEIGQEVRGPDDLGRLPKERK